jgi:catechol 2,3-dioxygenase-like lactoylglutathione lyase family enzyme
MPEPSAGPARRAGALAVHSLSRFVTTVPDLDAAERFHRAFGLDVRRSGDRLDLHTFGGPPSPWATIHAAPGRKTLQFLSFSCFEGELEAIAARAAGCGAERIDPHPFGTPDGLWLRHPDGWAVQVSVGPKKTPDRPTTAAVPPGPVREAGRAPARSAVREVRPRRLSHVLLFSPDPPRCWGWLQDVLGLRMSDWSGGGIAFLHGAHGSDHHLVAVVMSEGPGLHHCSWDVASLDEVGLGMEQMLKAGYTEGWGVGRHVLGSNYFYYARDPFGGYNEFSFDIDHVAADDEWPARDQPPDDSFYVWGPQVPPYFVVNTEIDPA